MKISVVIPNYNGRQLLEKNLPIIIKATRGCEVIVVDDASDDDSVDFLKTRFPEVKVLTSSKNRGFSSTVNYGFEKAEGELILLLNTDVYPKARFMEPLLSYFKDPAVFGVGLLQESREKEGVILRGRGLGEFRRGFLVHWKGEADKKDTLWISAGAGIFRKNLWLKLGGLDEKYNPFYWEDIDLSWRAVKKGYKIYFEFQSKVVHEQKKGAIRNKYTPDQIKRIAYRNQFYFIRKNFNNPSGLLRHYLWLPYHFLKAVKRGDWAFFRGFLDSFIFR